MNRRLPIILLSLAALVALPTAASATGGHGAYDRGSDRPAYCRGHDRHDDKHAKDDCAPQPTTAPTAVPGDLCGGRRAGDVIPWSRYTCEQATGYFLYKKLDQRKPVGFWNSSQQHRVALHPVWAWPTADASARKEPSRSLPRDAQVIPLALDVTDAAAVCAEPRAYGLQVDLVGNGEAGRQLDLASAVPTIITPPDGGFGVPNTLAYYGHYEVSDLVDLAVLCAPAVVVPTPSASPTPAPSPTPTPDVKDEPTAAPTPVPSPSPSETSEVLPAPAETPTPVAAPSPTASPTPARTPAPTPTERAEVLSAVDDSNRLAATGTQAALGLLAAVAAIAGGAALVLARRRHRTES